MKQKNVTLKCVAITTGVGLGTVDSIINNRGRASSETRKRILVNKRLV